MSAGQDIAKEREGLRLKAYPDPGSGGAPWTIGYGHTEGVRQGDTCTIEQAEAWFQEDWAKAEAIVLAAVTVKLSPQQLDALTCFVFNVGRGAKNVKDGFVELRNGQPSTMLRKINAGDFLGAAAQFDLWTKAAGRVMSGLVIRRKKEKALFLSGTNIPESAFPQPQEKDMAPFLMAAIPALIQELPNFAKIFQNKNVAERNVEAVSKAADIIVKSVPGAANLQDAVEKIQTDPDAKAVANEAVKMNTADIMDIIERTSKIDEASVAAARKFYDHDEPVAGKWRFVHILSIILILLGGIVAVAVIFHSNDATERAMALQTLLLVGFASVVYFWLGSSRSSQLKDMLDRNEPGRR